jgi:photosystem II stability/assembly factor-like uncharacterized protein
MASWHLKSRVATAALLALVVLDVVLVDAALRSTRSNGIDTSPVSSAYPSFDPTTAPASPSPTSSVTPAAAPLQTMIVALDNNRAWRVGAGSCSAGGATLATTVDGGKTWAKGNANLRRIVRVRPTDNQAAFIIGADASCVAQLRATSDGGGTWVGGGDPGSAWFRDPQNPLVVRAPGSAMSQPCGKRAVLDLASLTAGSSRVLCADGLVRSTTDNGTTWNDVGTVAGAVALAVPPVNPAQTYVARLGAAGCTGVQILRVDQQVATSCVQTAIPAGPGQIAMSLVKGGGWLAIGNVTMRSTDDLVTWRVS